MQEVSVDEVWKAYLALGRYAQMIGAAGARGGYPAHPYPAERDAALWLAAEATIAYETQPIPDVGPADYAHLYLWAQWLRTSFPRASYLGPEDGWTGLAWLPLRSLRARIPEAAKAAWGKMHSEVRWMAPEERQRIYPYIEDPLVRLPAVVFRQHERAGGHATRMGCTLARVLAAYTIFGRPRATVMIDGGWHPYTLCTTPEVWSEPAALPGRIEALHRLLAILPVEDARAAFVKVAKTVLPPSRQTALATAISQTLAQLGGRTKVETQNQWRTLRRQLAA